jgi:hypothetical protein
VRVERHDGRFLAWARSARPPDPRPGLELRRSQRIDAAFFGAAVRKCAALREPALTSPSDGVRLVHGEPTACPG